MADKVIDIDPSKRLSKEALTLIKETVNGLDAEELETLVVIFTPKNQQANLIAYGATFYTLGMAQAMLTTLGQELLKQDFQLIER